MFPFSHLIWWTVSWWCGDGDIIRHKVSDPLSSDNMWCISPCPSSPLLTSRLRLSGRVVSRERLEDAGGGWVGVSQSEARAGAGSQSEAGGECLGPEWGLPSLTNYTSPLDTWLSGRSNLDQGASSASFVNALCVCVTCNMSQVRCQVCIDRSTILMPKAEYLVIHNFFRLLFYFYLNIPVHLSNLDGFPCKLF